MTPVRQIANQFSESAEALEEFAQYRATPRTYHPPVCTDILTSVASTTPKNNILTLQQLFSAPRHAHVRSYCPAHLYGLSK